MKLAELAEKLSCRLEGDPAAEITAVAGMDHAAPGNVTFLANRRYFPLLQTTRATAIFIEDGVRIERDPGLPALAALRTGNPYFAFARAIELFYQPPTYAPGIHPTAVIAKSAKIGAGAHIGPYCFVDEDVASAQTRCCTASSPFIEARRSAISSSLTPTPSFANTADRQPRHSPERRHHRRGRSRLRQAERRLVVQDGSIRTSRPRR